MRVGDLVELIGSDSYKNENFIILSIECKCDKLGLYPYKIYTLLNIKNKEKEFIKVWNVEYWNYIKINIINHSYYTYLCSIYYTYLYSIYYTLF